MAKMSEMTSSSLLALESLYERRYPLIAERNVILGAPFLFVRPQLKRRLTAIDSQLDALELEISRLRKHEWWQTKPRSL